MSDEAVRAQYEAWPYPRRDPRDESRRLVTGSPSHFDEIVHYVFGGADPTAGGKRFRALVAGGGTGDGTIMLARQLADRGADAELVYIDVSRAAMRVARARAAARRLRNVRFVRASLLELAGRDLGPFDYIDCCGVLHHLDDPAAGLRGLAAALADGGGMGLMVYGELGRTGVYHAQEALRLLGSDEAPADRIALARRFLGDLRESNWLMRNPWVADHLHGDDAGLYDLLLHSRDRAFTVPEAFELARAAGLDITGFIEPVRYDPAAWLDDPDLAARAARLSWPERCALAELLSGNLKRHVFYAVKAGAGGHVAAPDSENAVPVLREADGEALAHEIAARGVLRVEMEGQTFVRRFGPLAPAILSRIDGRRSLAEIRAALTAEHSWPDFKAAFDELYDTLNGLNVMLLRNGAA